MRRARVLAVPLILIAVALVQMVRVFTAGQSRWRGGGFGMYAELHPNATQIWLFESGSTGAAPTLLSESERAPTGDRVARCKRLRSTECLRQIARGLPALAPGRRLEIWLPDFDAPTGKLSRRRVASSDF